MSVTWPHLEHSPQLLYFMLQVCQPWDANKFNFQKALQQEVLFQYEAGLPSDGKAVKFIPASPANNSPNLVFINVSPIEYGHVLLVPRVMDGLTQLVDQTSMRLALQFCEHSNNAYFRLCYNSLGAYGTINHLHFQVRPPVYSSTSGRASLMAVWQQSSWLGLNCLECSHVKRVPLAIVHAQCTWSG